MIQVADGTYSGAVILKSLVGSGKCIIQGNIPNPSLVICTVIGAGGGANPFALFESRAFSSTWIIQGFQLQSSGTNWRAILSLNTGSIIQYKNLIIGAGFIRHICSFGGDLRCLGNYTIAASAQVHWELSSTGRLVSDTIPTVITLTGAPAFSIAFLLGSGQSNIYVASFGGYTSFSGSATGTRYNLQGLSYFVGAQGNQTYLPGNSAGGTLTGNSVYE